LHQSDFRQEASPVRVWRPAFPAGRLERIWLHWSGGDYRTLYPAYHFCVWLEADGEVRVSATHDLRENMRDVRADPEAPYAAHTRGRNSFAAGLAVMAMRGARPDDFGPFPLTEPLIDGLCAVAARLAAAYGIACAPGTIATHAEAAREDGYFGCEPEERWDIARLVPAQAPLAASEAQSAGDELRRRIANYLNALET
jgi:hypothetical protein